MKKNAYNPELDIWKFFFAIVVALHHTKRVYERFSVNKDMKGLL